MNESPSKVICVPLVCVGRQKVVSSVMRQMRLNYLGVSRNRSQYVPQSEPDRGWAGVGRLKLNVS